MFAFIKIRWFVIAHFSVAYLVTWLMSGNEAGVDIVLIETSLLSHVNHVFLMLKLHLHEKERFASKKGHLQPRSTHDDQRPGH